MSKEKKFDQMQYIREYNEKNYVRMDMRVKPEVKQKAKDRMSELGISLASYVTKLIQEDFEKDPVWQAFANKDYYEGYTEEEMELEENLIQALNLLGYDKFLNRFIEKVGIIESLEIIKEVLQDEDCQS